jgi:hypothetical protein
MEHGKYPNLTYCLNLIENSDNNTKQLSFLNKTPILLGNNAIPNYFLVA